MRLHRHRHLDARERGVRVSERGCTQRVLDAQARAAPRHQPGVAAPPPHEGDQSRQQERVERAVVLRRMQWN